MASSSDAATQVTSTPDLFRAACTAAQDQARAAVARLKSADRSRPQEILTAYDQATAALSDAGSRTSVVRNAHPDEAMRDAAEACEQDLEKLSTELALDRGIYDALSSVPLAGLDRVTRHWLEHGLRDFRRAGVDRDDATRDQVRSLNEELVKIGQDFGRNILTDVRFVDVDASALEGLPEDYRRAHPANPEGKVRITTDTPDYVPFMTYSRSSAAREQLWRTYRLRGHPKNAPVLDQLVKKRHQLATLLGYASWAAYVTEDKMIRSDAHASDFIEKITAASGARCQRDYDLLLTRKRKDHPEATEVFPWDQSHLEDRVRAEQYQFDSQSVRPYFEYARVRGGVLSITEKIFSLRYQKLEGAKVWHPEVEAYDVFGKAAGQDAETCLGRFYLDMHPRDGKYKHAAQFTLTTGRAGGALPEGVLMCNFPRAGELMQHRDVETFFHEFGHLLHHILGGHTKWTGLSGVRTEWDFVEAPSQMLEEWGWDADALATFARHLDTNEVLPRELVARMRAADEFGKGLWVRQQMYYAALSLELYRRDPAQLDVEALATALQAKYTPFRSVPGTYFHLSFGHLDGYSAIYYTYMWSLVIAKDLFTVFKKDGLMNPAPAGRYRRAVLEPGGSKDAAELVKDFLGREFSFEAYERWLNAA